MPHIHEKIDFVADVFVVYKDKVLIRKHDKHDKWFGVGGHIELHENPNEAAVREVKEEVGLDVMLAGEVRQCNGENDAYIELIPPRFMNIHAITPTHKHISLVYFAKSDSDKVIDEGREKSNGLKWFSKEDLKKNEEGISESIRFYALSALKELGE